jgi:hypothetical protein
MILPKQIGFFLYATVLVATTAMRAEDGPAVSPFLPSNTATLGKAGQTDPNALQLRGIMNLGAQVKYCIYDPAKKASVWLAVNQKGEDYVVANADAGHGTVTVEQQGRRITLEIENNHVSGAAITTSKNKIREPLTPEQQQKLKSIADIVRKKQLEREQALTAGLSDILNNSSSTNSTTDTSATNQSKQTKRQMRSKSNQ